MSTLEIVFNTVSALCGVGGMAGGFVAWWMANKSRQAQQKAEAAERRSETISTSLKKIAAGMNQESFTLTPASHTKNNATWYLRNLTDRPLQISAILNAHQIPGLDLPTPLTIEPHTVFELTRLPVSGAARTLEIKLSNGEQHTLIFQY